MTNNPLYNAAAAAGYVVAIVLLIHYGGQFAAGKPDTMIIPMAMLSLFVLSAAVMAFLFFYQPVVMFVEGRHREAIALFARTLGYFAAITAVFLLGAFLI